VFIEHQSEKAAMENTGFLRRLLYCILRDSYEFQNNNYDFLIFGTTLSNRIKRQLEDKVLILANKLGFVRRHFAIEQAPEQLVYIVDNLDKFESFYYLLQDDYSRQLLIALLEFRILGAQHVKLPLNNKQYWDKRASIDKVFLKKRRTIKAEVNWYLNRYELKGLSGSLSVYTHKLGILNTFLLEQYAYRRGNSIVQVQPGDIVIDGGSCWGDTALYFADKTGPQGKVYCFEFVPGNLEIIQRNMELNKHLAGRIEVVPNALWDKSGEIAYYCDSGPSTRLLGDKQQSTMQIPTLSIDDFAKKERLERIDYIKMDIEGSELKALQGAEDSIRTFKPKLAISLYHREDDFFVIPDYLDRLGLRYEFFLDHFTICSHETVLFAAHKPD